MAIVLDPFGASAGLPAHNTVAFCNTVYSFVAIVEIAAHLIDSLDKVAEPKRSNRRATVGLQFVSVRIGIHSFSPRTGGEDLHRINPIETEIEKLGLDAFNQRGRLDVSLSGTRFGAQNTSRRVNTRQASALKVRA